ncbi:MAG: ABC transporter ATP-binding protein [Candidatus Aenigmarchaeota archaeon]|nr:ABC transporter ATP-binding protein [Candidatus Aenigmarchaeota archaeon]
MVDDTINSAGLEKQIEFGLVRGLQKKEMYSALTSAGWPSDLVNNYLEKIQSEIGPAALLQVNVSKRFGSKTVIDGVTIDVRPGEVLGIIGLSGSGKTTLLKMIAGFLMPDAGDVSLNVENKCFSLFQHKEFAKRWIGFSTQTPSFYDKLTVRENLEHFALLYGLSDVQSRVSLVLRKVALSDKQHQLAGELSGGQQKILDIACSIIHKPSILVLDEPAANMDIVSVKNIFEIIRQINETGTTVILATHLLADLDGFCDRVAFLRNGKITECASPSELKKVFSRTYQIELVIENGSDQFLSVIKKYPQLFPKIISYSPLKVTTPMPKRALRFIAAMLSKSKEPISSVSVSRPSLNEVFDLLSKK